MKKYPEFFESNIDDNDAKIDCDQSWRIDYPNTQVYENYADFVKRGDNGNFYISEVRDFCDSNSSGLLINRELNERFTDDNRFLVESVSFQHNDEWAMGREDSMHGVRFGHLTVGTTDSKNHEMAVALKPFDKPQKAINELSAMVKLPDTIGVQSFEPIGIIKGSKEQTILVTRFEPDVVSFDNYNWDQSIDESVVRSLDLNEALQKSAHILALLHEAGFNHNDAQIKNMAVDTRTNPHSIRLIDLENTTWRFDPERDDLTTDSSYLRYLDGVYNDVASLVSSVLKRGLWADAGQVDKERAIDVWFRGPYNLCWPVNITKIAPGQPMIDTNIRQDVAERIESALENI